MIATSAVRQFADLPVPHCSRFQFRICLHFGFIISMSRSVEFSQMSCFRGYTHPRLSQFCFCEKAKSSQPKKQCLWCVSWTIGPNESLTRHLWRGGGREYFHDVMPPEFCRTRHLRQRCQDVAFLHRALDMNGLQHL